MTLEIEFHGTDRWPLKATVLGEGPPVVLLHGGGPDHHSMLPLAQRLADRHTTILPDIRGYGRSICPDPALHTWATYTSDLLSLLDALHLPAADLIGAGLGGTVALRTCLAAPERVRRAVVISPEDIEDDQAKAGEAALMDKFAERVRADGIEAGWSLFLPLLVPLIANLVRDAIPRSDPASIAASAAIGHDRAFGSPDELAAVEGSVLIIPGADERHPATLAARVAEQLPRGSLAPVGMSKLMRTADDLASAFAPVIRNYLAET